MIIFDRAELLFETDKDIIKLMTQYKCAMLEVKTKLDVLNTEMSLKGEHNPFQSIVCRIKSPESIVEKLKRKELKVTAEDIYNNLTDVAGIRVVCSYPDDIYVLADRLCSQDDITVLERKDYIKNPKPNGYRSLHLILEVPVFFMAEKKNMIVEVQLRTIAMDFWASLEHKIRYKKQLTEGAEEIADELCTCAEEIAEIDARMQEIRNKIDRLTNTN